MSEEVSAVELSTQVDAAADLDWDAAPEEFPAMEVEGQGNEESSEESVEGSEDSSPEAVREEASEEDQEAPREIEEPKTEDKSGEQESPEENKQEVVDINELPDDTIIKAKVDGEVQEISLKEYKNGISGEKAIAKRFSEYDKKEKEFKAELNEVNEYVNTFAQKMQSGDPVAALEYLTQFTETPAYEVKDMLIQALLPEIERRQELIPEQLDLEKTQAKLEFEKEKAETEKKKFEAEQAKMDLNAKVSSARQTHQISQEDWDSAFKHLDASLPPSEQITIDTVKEYVLFSRAESALNLVDSNLVSDKGIMNSFVDIQAKNPDFTEEDLLAIAKDAFGKAEQAQAKEELQEVAQTKQEKVNPVKKPAQAQQIQELDADDWGDIL